MACLPVLPRNRRHQSCQCFCIHFSTAMNTSIKPAIILLNFPPFPHPALNCIVGHVEALCLQKYFLFFFSVNSSPSRFKFPLRPLLPFSLPFRLLGSGLPFHIFPKFDCFLASTLDALLALALFIQSTTGHDAINNLASIDVLEVVRRNFAEDAERFRVRIRIFNRRHKRRRTVVNGVRRTVRKGVEEGGSRRKGSREDDRVDVLLFNVMSRLCILCVRNGLPCTAEHTSRARRCS